MTHWVQPLIPAELQDIVPRGTIEQLTAFADLVRKWNPKINLVAKSSLDELWHRHIVDSLQLALLAPDATTWSDLGSGGGFPGVVLAIARPATHFTLIESDQRKAAFLTVARQSLSLANLTVLAKRIDQVEPQGADVVSARALAPLPDLLAHVHRHLDEQGLAVLPKGRGAADETAAARQLWDFQVETRASMTDAEASILLIRNIRACNR